jgi:hypothetical protein
MNKLQIKAMTEKTGKLIDGKPEMRQIGTLYMESTAGRVQELLDEHGDAFLADLLDNQILHHQGSAAFKAKGTKNDPKEGLDRLPRFPEATRQLYRSTKAEAEKEGFDVSGLPDDAEVVMVNWSFQPGTSQAAIAKETAIQKAIELQLELLGGEVSPELRAKVEQLVRSRM